MKRLFLPATVLLCAASAAAQPPQIAAPGVEPQAVRDQRRAELRTVLQANRPTDALTPVHDDPVPASRHLSARERAEMRQQLRQQQSEERRGRP